MKRKKYQRYTKEDDAKIIAAYEDLKQLITIHPTYWEIAKKAKCSIAYVYKTIKAYKAQNKAFGLQK